MIVPPTTNSGLYLRLCDLFSRAAGYFFLPVFRGGTFAPSLRACERPMAIACLRLVTFLPERPLFSVPRFRSCIACSTFFEAFLPYLGIASTSGACFADSYLVCKQAATPKATP
jgi:hypothetical protein